MNTKKTYKLTIESEHGSDIILSAEEQKQQGSEPLRTKKATTIMPKEVFNLLQRYCTETDTPKHRAVYLFILDGLHAAAAITDDEYARFRDMAALLTTTYEKK